MLSLTDDLKAIRTDAAPGYTYVDEIGVFVHNMHAVTVQEIRAELADPTYQQYRHGRCATNNRGCSGPMCRWARRNWRRENRAELARRRGKPYDPTHLVEHRLAEDVYQLFDMRIEKFWQAHQAKKKLEREIQKAVKKSGTGLLFAELM